MSTVPMWYIFPCNVDTGPTGDGPARTDWGMDYSYAYTWAEAITCAKHIVMYDDYDYAAITMYVPGKGLELHSTFGLRPSRNDYDLVGTRADGYEILRRWCERVLAGVQKTEIMEGA